MDPISYSKAAQQEQRIKKFVAEPDAVSGLVTVPSIVASGETVSIPAGRTLVHPNLQVDGTLEVDGTLFIPSGGSVSTTEVDATVVKQNGSVVANEEDLATLLPKSGGTMNGAITALRETKVAMGADNIDLATGNVFTKTITATTTLTVSNVLASGNANRFILELTNGGAYAITWFSGIKWAGGTVPTLTASGVDILGFYSHDGGTTYRAVILAKDSK